MTKIINMTPHAIVLGELHPSSVDGTKFFVPMKRIEASGKTIRLKAATVPVFKIEDTVFAIQISKTVFGEPVGLPDFANDTYYIVSQIVKTAFPNRLDLLVPAEMQRNSDGQIIGCLSLGQ